ncbi:gliding motility-associated C-terminal domain-containing protein [Ferruginibacter sp. SUN002]|uniref:T9SS type B sorting domain-containing protein n=1 Tax=Ferruginibacter sp. SUN002 TaxID=2937789 RepID=UPI003D36BD74
MNMKHCVTVLLICFLVKICPAQNCTALGQNPATAFPVCGTADFVQTSVPVCGGRQVPAASCPSDFLSDINPYWYKFKCFTSGTLGFVIKPTVFDDDYDWQLFDVTGRNPGDVYSDPTLFVACNWSGESGNTGTNASAQALAVCGSAPTLPIRPLFSKMPVLQQGHDYLLLISHFDGATQSGYTLSFDGGTANITDPVEPHLKSARAICDGTQMTVKLNKRMKCKSLAANGSDFTISSAVSSIIAASGVHCSDEFDMDSVVLTLDNPLPPGMYNITMKNGTDGSTLFDNCDRTIPVGESLPVTVYPLFPTPMDSLTKFYCAPQSLQLVFSKLMQCNTIAADGSDFVISGSFPVSIASAKGVCNTDNLTTIIDIQLSAPIQKQGNFSLRLKNGTDGNTILNECGQPTPAGSTINFSTVDTVSAVFSTTPKLDCKVDGIDYAHDGRNGVNIWQWTFDDNITSTAKDTSIIYSVFGQKNATLIVSNGVCRDTFTRSVTLDNHLKAAFEGTGMVCPTDMATFKDQSIGNIIGWNWDFGNGLTSTLQTPPTQQYPYTNILTDYTVRLIVKNNLDCFDTATQKIKVLANCFIAVPTGFTPNGDGLNDYLYPTNALKAIDLYFAVYNRLGQLLFETNDWTKKWDGTYNGQGQDPGTYVWRLEYTEPGTGQRKTSKGTTVLIR